MAASIARKIAAVLFAVAMVGSVAVGPAVASDDDVSVGGDGVSVGGDDGVTVGAGDDGSANGSTTVSAEAGQDGVDADATVSGGDGSGTSGSLDCGVSSSTQDPSDACETSGGGSGTPSLGDTPGAPDSPETPGAPDSPELGDAPEAPSSGGGSGGSAPSTTMEEISTPDEPIEAPNLPVDYSDVPFDAFPNFCTYPQYVLEEGKSANPVDPTDPLPGAVKERLPKQAPKKPPSTPVGNPVGLVGLPVSQCTFFNPYNPAVNPTSPPDDPSASASGGPTALGADRVSGYLSTESTTGQDAPGAETFNGIVVTREETLTYNEVYATNGRSESGASLFVAGPNDPRKMDAMASATVFGQGASVILNCDDGQCKPKAGGVPSGNSIPAIPTGGSSGGEDPQPSPSADGGQPSAGASQNGAYISDDRSATLGPGLPSGSNDVFAGTNGDIVYVSQDGQAEGRSSNVETMYARGQYPGDDDVYVLAKAEGAGVIVGLNCDNYRCTPSENTGVYPGPASMVFGMIPDAPAP